MSANGYAPTDISLPASSASNTVAGIVANQVISKETRVTRSGSTSLVVAAELSGVTQVGTITLKLQTALDSTWSDSKTTTVTANGMAYIRLLDTVAGDQTFLPLLCKIRLVVTTTNASDALTVDAVSILQGE